MQFETIDMGAVPVDEHFTLEVRLLKAAPDAFYWLTNGAALDGPHPSAELARARIEKAMPKIVWRGDPLPRQGEARCPICAAPVRVWSRHPRLVCGACVFEAVDSQGYALRFSNTDIMGYGFRASRPDGTESPDGNTCYIRGVRCHADEARFGGIVVEVLLPRRTA